MTFGLPTLCALSRVDPLSMQKPVTFLLDLWAKRRTYNPQNSKPRDPGR